MNHRFEVGGAVVAATPSIFRLFDATDNPNYYSIDGTAPATEQWVSGLTVTSYGAFKLEVGLCDTNKANFTPYYSTFATLSTAGGLVKRWDEGQPPIPMSLTRVLAVRITVYADATVYAAGDIDLRSR